MDSIKDVLTRLRELVEDDKNPDEISATLKAEGYSDEEILDAYCDLAREDQKQVKLEGLRD